MPAQGSVCGPGYRGAGMQQGTQVYHHKLKRDITPRLRRDIRRRSAIEPAIGHMKNDGRLRRNWLQGAHGDAFNARLCVRSFLNYSGRTKYFYGFHCGDFLLVE